MFTQNLAAWTDLDAGISDVNKEHFTTAAQSSDRIAWNGKKQRIYKYHFYEDENSIVSEAANLLQMWPIGFRDSVDAMKTILPLRRRSDRWCVCGFNSRDKTPVRESS